MWYPRRRDRLCSREAKKSWTSANRVPLETLPVQLLRIIKPAVRYDNPSSCVIVRAVEQETNRRGFRETDRTAFLSAIQNQDEGTKEEFLCERIRAQARLLANISRDS